MAVRARRIREGAERGGRDDLVRQYLNELGAFPLLTAADEIELSTAIQAGRDAEAVLDAASADPDGERLGPDERRRLTRAAKQGADARRRFIQSNLRLVVSIAKRYQASGLPLLDLIQEGNLGLMRAVEKFDHRKGFKFSTYATWWIRQAIGRAIADKSRTIRVPAHLGDTLSVLARTSSHLLKTLGREPTAAELAAETGFSLEKVERRAQAEPDLVSLSRIGRRRRRDELGDLLADASAEAPFEAAAAALEPWRYGDSLSTLHDTRARGPQLRFGLGGDQPLTLEEVGGQFNLTRERIRQIEAKALTKLRHPCLPGHLRAGSRSVRLIRTAATRATGTPAPAPSARRWSRAAARAARPAGTSAPRGSQATRTQHRSRRRRSGGPGTRRRPAADPASTTTAGSPTSSTSSPTSSRTSRRTASPGASPRFSRPPGVPQRCR